MDRREALFGLKGLTGSRGILREVRRTVRAVMAYFGRLPVAQARSCITVTERSRVSHGKVRSNP
jgi:hypothetical protein